MIEALDIDKVIALWAEHGVAGLVILCGFVFVWWIVKHHRAERSEWRKEFTEERELSQKCFVAAMDRQTRVLERLEAIITIQQARH
jgi:hypothetical protein